LVKVGTLLLAGAMLASAVWFFIGTNTDKTAIGTSTQAIAVSSHAAFAKDAVYPVRVGIEDLGHLNNWLSYRLGKRLNVNTLENIGYQLLGGNVVPDNGRVSASIVYEGPQNTRVSLFIQNASGTNSKQSVDHGVQGRFNWLSWGSVGRQFVLVSELDKTELVKVQKALK